VGTDVRKLSVGDEVAAFAFDCLASHAVTDARLAVRRPLSLDTEKAAGVPVAFMTASYALNHLARISGGDRVLVHSATGGVGLAALQLARRAGAEIFATAGTETKREWLRSLGIRHVFDSRSGQFAREVLEATGGDGVDIVLNSLAGDAVEQGLSVLRPYGRFVEIGKRDIYENRQVGLLPFQRNLSYFAVDLDRMARERPAFLGSLLEEVMGLVDRGDIQPLPTRTFPLGQVADAFREMAQGRHTGKLVVSVREGALPRAAGATDPVEASIGGTVLITGGLGALGLHVAEWLVRRGITHLALLGRSGGAGGSLESLRRIEARGVVVKQLRADVADAAQLAAALDEIRRDMPPLTGVVHAAGYLDDATVLQQAEKQFLDVMRPKVSGAWHLDRLTADDPLEFFVLMGSVASFFGLSGQSNYAAANAFLDALAEDRMQRGRPALSVSWGPWSGGGLAARADRGSRLAGQGLDSLNPDEGIAALERLLQSRETHIVAMRCDVDAWIASAQGAALPILTRTHVDDVAAKAGQQSDRNVAGIREALEQAQPGRQRCALLEGWLRDQVAQVLRMAPARVELTKPFRTMGLDSLMGLELRNRLESGAAISLPATAIWNHPTVAQLAPQVAIRMGVALEAAQPQTTITEPVATIASDPGETSTELDELISELEQLSDEEARRLVAGDL
jgi:NADPH:quinone reductase-like Zn-dependent oxidoreductase/acyl carrier protein